MRNASDHIPPKEASRRNRGFEPAAKLVMAQIKSPAERRGFAEARLITQWREIMGPEFADIARPVKLSHGRDGFGATLVLLTSGAHAPILEMRKEDIRTKVNAAYGYNAVSKISLTQTAGQSLARDFIAPRPRPELPQEAIEIVNAKAKAAAAHITDEGLRDALERLAQRVIRKQTS